MNLRTKQMLAENFITDVMSQLDVVDPSEECEEITEVISLLMQTSEGQTALCFLLGLPEDELESWVDSSGADLD